MGHFFLPYSVAMVTPFTNEGMIDEEALVQLLKYYQTAETEALLVSGSTGEQHSISIEERCQLYRMVKHYAPEITMYAGVAAFTTEDAIKLAKAAEEAGANGIMLGFPPYVIPTQENVIEYVTAVAAITSLPIMLYNNPRRTGTNLEQHTLYHLLDTVSSVVALKEAGDEKRIPKIKDKYPHLQVFSGSDLQIALFFQLQYDGLTSIIGNILPKQMKEVVCLLKKGAEKEAVILLEKYRLLYEAVTTVPAPVGIKYALSLQGISAGVPRKPLGNIPKQFKERIEKEWKQLYDTIK